MATEVILPRLGQGMESGTIVRWLKAEGDQVEKGEPLFELDTDKVTQEVEAETSGVLLRIAVAEGEVPVGRTVAFIGAAGETVAETEAAASRSRRGRAAGRRDARGRAGARGPGRDRVPHRDRERSRQGVAARAPHRARPRRRPAAAAGNRARGPHRRRGRRARGRRAGPAAAAAPVAAGAVERRPLSNIRKTIARRLTQAWTVPAFMLTVSIDMTRANEVVAGQRERNPDVRITVTDLLTKVCAQALMRHRDMNVQFAEDELLVFGSADVGIAVAAPVRASSSRSSAAPSG